ncbi:MAG: carboxypeptidase regulatory-like domain-containing protein [Candidatus Acidiferrum sp.]
MNRLRQVCWLVAIAALVLISMGAPGVLAQDVTASIYGTVTDPSGAAVVGANVTAKSIERGITYTAVTDDAGLYRISQLPVGNYELRVEKQGFQTTVHPAFTLVLNQSALVDVALKVGQVSQTVEVTGAAPILKTESTQVDTVIDANTNDALPLATRNYVELTLLSPGAIHPDPSSFNNGDNVNSGARPFINGNREQSNNFLLDGMDNNEVSDNLLGYTPSPDSIQEFNLITNNAPAEFGNFMGGIVSATLKSGTNSFHGDVWEFFRNDVLNANQWENKINPSAEIGRAPLRWNMFGGTLGGPVFKNKLFFFIDYQGQRFDHPPAGSFISVFTPAEQGGDFSALCQSGFTGGVCNDRASNPGDPPPTGSPCVSGDTRANCVVANQLYNPCAAGTGISGVACTPSAAANANRPIFANNQIPVGMISPVAAALFASSLYPKTINNNLTNNAIEDVSTAYNQDQGDVKIDYRISDRDQLSGRFTRAFQIDPSTNSQALFGNGQVTAPIWSTVGDWTHTLTPNMLNDLRFGWNHIVLNTGTSWDPSVGAFGQTIGIPNSNPSGLDGLLGLVFGAGTPSSPGSGTLTNIGNSMVTQSFNSKVYQFDDGITWTHGRHTFKFGGQFWHDNITVFYSGNSGSLGNIIFGPNFTASSATCTDATNCASTSPVGGNGIGDFFLGLPSGFGRGLSSGTWTQTSNIMAGYAQDTWRVSDHLTLNLGLRYEAHTPWVESNNQQVNYNIQSGQIEYAGQDGNSDALYNGVYGAKDFQPRLGFAWTPGGRLGDHTVIRGAFTISDYLEGTGTNLRLPLNPPYDGGATAGGEFQTLYTTTGSTTYPLPLTTLSDGIIAPPAAGLSCPNLSCYADSTFRLWDQNVQPAISDQANLTIQHQFGNDTTLQVGYVGQVGNHLMVPFKYNQLVALPDSACGTPPCTGPSPFFANGEGPALAAIIDSTGGTVSGTQSNGRMMYNALQAVLKKTMNNGLQYQVSYTFSKCMSNNTGYYGTWSTARASSTASPYWQNVYDPQAEWAPCYYDAANTLTSYAVYDLPFGQGKRFGSGMGSAANAVVGGWEISPILSLHTGFPLALYNNSGDPTGTLSGGIRPNCDGTNQVLGRSPAPAGTGGGFLWFNPSNYTNNTSGFGTCAPQIGGLRGPGYYNWDISLHKDFHLTERFMLQFRSDFLNAFNRVNLAVPNTTVDQSTTGVIQASQPARNIQFALKLYY